MSLKEKIKDDIKQAIRDNNESRLGTLRMLSAAIQRREIPHGRFERRLALPAGHWQLAGQELAHGCLQLLLVRR